jgi:CheY-like chemotaxis protein
MSIFAPYFATQLLREAGWPRKLGRFKGEGYDAVIADDAFAQSIDWGAAIGAGHPRLALQMIAEMFRDRVWDGEEGPDVKLFVKGAQEAGWSTADSPRDAVKPLQFAEGMATISVEQFKDPQLRTALEHLLFQALLWGLSNPDRVEAWYASSIQDHQSMLPAIRRAGVEVGELPSLPQFFEDSAAIVRDYEREIGPLPSIPARLLADAGALGWRVSTVLIIDDEASIRLLCRVNLEAAGMCVLEVPDGPAGVKMASETTPDLILLDVQMPGPNGLNVARQLRETAATSTIPIVFLSPRVEFCECVNNLGYADIQAVAEPFNPLDLFSFLDGILRHARETRATRPTELDDLWSLSEIATTPNDRSVGDAVTRWHERFRT